MPWRAFGDEASGGDDLTGRDRELTVNRHGVTP
jgi:hypothetical protein